VVAVGLQSHANYHGTCCSRWRFQGGGTEDDVTAAEDIGRCLRRCSRPATVTDMSRPSSTSRRHATKPRSLASSHTGKRGHDVRQASSTSGYGREPGPIHSRRSRIRDSTVSDIEAAYYLAGDSRIAALGL
jgi:hypothetical protein